jgi:aryl-alcohol dehydrogenase-like predicted oxidoreductase
MQKRPLGKSGIDIAPLVLGGNVFGWTADEPTSFAILDAFMASGCNAIDTADVYSAFIPGNKGGESETVIGNWLKRRGRRDDVIVMTKVGMQMSPEKTGLKAAYIKQACEDSLQRLQTDYIDLYQAHRDDDKVPLEESLEAFSQLVKQGKVRAIGASNYSGARLEQALEVSRKAGLPTYQSLQPHYNLYERAGYEADQEKMCLKHGIGVITYFALASGFLTGKYRSEADFNKSPRGRRMANYLNDRGKRILAALDEVAKSTSSTPAQVALAWQIARPSVTAPIASATSVAQLNDIVASTRVKLDAAAIARLDEASKQ